MSAREDAFVQTAHRILQDISAGEWPWPADRMRAAMEAILKVRETRADSSTDRAVPLSSGESRA